MRMRAPGGPGFIARSLMIAILAAAAGCSADVTRFSYNGSQTTGSIPLPDEPIGRAPPPRGLGLSEAPLPPASNLSPSYAPQANGYGNNSYQAPPPYAGAPKSDAVGDYRVVGRTYKTPPPPAQETAYLPPPRQQLNYPPPAHAGGETVEVQPGETLYSIAQRRGVAVAAIKDANGLTSDNVRLGQRLVIPADARDRSPAPQPFAKAPPALDRTAKYAPAPPAPPASPSADAPPGWEGRYTVKNGDTPYGVALQHHVSLEELMRANGISDPSKVWAGRVLYVPTQSAPAVTQAPPQNTVPRVVQVPPRVINAQPDAPKTFARSDTPVSAPPPSEAAAGKFRWPVKGRILAGFGKRPDGSHNDGVNVAVPQGTEITAAEAGKVAYAGNELKGYGNLVLIRHANGWVSAYAHADQILVKPNDEVRRGQVIARAGKTGAVDQPQLHFELRQGSRPVDPVPHLMN